jgi:hypothetical protein
MVVFTLILKGPYNATNMSYNDFVLQLYLTYTSHSVFPKNDLNRENYTQKNKGNHSAVTMLCQPTN